MITVCRHGRGEWKALRYLAEGYGTGTERRSGHRWSDLSLSSWYGSGFAELRFLKYFLMTPSIFEAVVHHYNHYKQLDGPAFLLTPGKSQAWICSITLPFWNRSSCGWIRWRKITLQTEQHYFKYLIPSPKHLVTDTWTSPPKLQGNSPFLPPSSFCSKRGSLPQYYLAFLLHCIEKLKTVRCGFYLPAPKYVTFPLLPAFLSPLTENHWQQQPIPTNDLKKKKLYYTISLHSKISLLKNQTLQSYTHTHTHFKHTLSTSYYAIVTLPGVPLSTQPFAFGF